MKLDVYFVNLVLIRKKHLIKLAIVLSRRQKKKMESM